MKINCMDANPITDRWISGIDTYNQRERVEVYLLKMGEDVYQTP